MLNTDRPDLRFFARKFLQTYASEYIQPDRACKIWRNFCSSPLGESLNIIEKIQDQALLVDTSFVPETARGR